MLHRFGAHAEVTARIDWCVTERALGVITGEVGAGKTVAVRAALASLDTSRNTVIYLGNPTVGGRGLVRRHCHSTRRRASLPQGGPDSPDHGATRR